MPRRVEESVTRPPIRIAVLMAVHNRVNFTRETLSKLVVNSPDINLCIHIFDDGSTDATKSEISRYLNVSYLEGSGEAYWARSMKYAQDSVSEPVDYLLWLNNDVVLADDFFPRILESLRVFPNSILVGQTCDVDSKKITYGGLRRIGRHPHRFQMINAQTEHESADTFCGNIVLIPNRMNLALGGIDGNYEHGYADYDFGYRAKMMGIDIRIIPEFLGTCLLNPSNLIAKSRLESLKILTSTKYLPIRSQIRFCKRHGGPEWPVYVIAPYLRIFLKFKRFKSNQITPGF